VSTYANPSTDEQRSHCAVCVCVDVAELDRREAAVKDGIAFRLAAKSPGEVKVLGLDSDGRVWVRSLNPAFDYLTTVEGAAAELAEWMHISAVRSRNMRCRRTIAHDGMVLD
jgi:hypothetical protein